MEVKFSEVPDQKIGKIPFGAKAKKNSKHRS